MTSLHWAAYNGDDGVVKYLLEYKEIQDEEEVRVVDPYVYSYNNQLPIDIAGHRPSVQCLDAFLAQFQIENELPKNKRISDQKAEIDKLCDRVQDFAPLAETERFEKTNKTNKSIPNIKNTGLPPINDKESARNK